MPIPEKCYISTVICVVSFKLDNDIRHQSREFEKEFGGITNSQVEATNVPDEFPAEIPRLTLKSANKQISLSKQNIQINLTFERNDNKSVEEQFEIVSKNIRKFWSAICKFKKQESRKEVGLILTLYLPSEKMSSFEISASNFDRFSKMERLGEIAHYNVSAGFKSDHFFKIFNAASYEVRSGKINSLSNVPLSVKIDEMKIEEIGFEYKFDVNNKLKVQEIGFSEDASGEQILGELRHFLFTDSAKLIGW